jgi:hypothetical protein
VSMYVLPAATSSTLGAVLAVYAAPSLNISSSSFENARGKSGGSCYVKNVLTIYITSCQFTGSCALSGPGGALFFGENTGFAIEGGVFFSFF